MFATLRGALFAIGDEELLEYHRLAGAFRPFQRVANVPSGLEHVRDALDVLRGRCTRAGTRGLVADTVAELLAVTRAHVGFVLRPAGEQAPANVLHVGELARRARTRRRHVVPRFRGAAARGGGRGQAAEAPILEEGSDGVRLMTVHKAKGLEFPVVILADITARLTPNEVSRHVDLANERCALRLGGYYGWAPKDLNDQRTVELRREEAEGARVAYVAATRARDLLVDSGRGRRTAYDEGWLAPLNAAIYPDDARRRMAEAGPGCPPFKSRDSVLERPGNDPASIRTVRPGRHLHAEGAAALRDGVVVARAGAPRTRRATACSACGATISSSRTRRRW